MVFPDRTKYKIDYSDEFQDLVNKLLVKDRTKRIGSGADDYLEIMNHSFFKDVDIDKFLAQDIKPPYKPTVKKEDYRYFDTEEGQALTNTALTKEQKQIVDQKNQ